METVIKSSSGIAVFFLLYSSLSFAVWIDSSSWDSSMWTNQLLLCVQRGDIRGCKQALAQGAQINKKDRRGRTPLMWAIHYRRRNVVQFLLERRANVSLKDDKGRMALHRAASAGPKDIVSLLLKYGADPSVLDKKQESPLDKVVFCSKNRALLSLLWSNENAEKLSKSWYRIIQRVDNKMFECLINRGLSFGEVDLEQFKDKHKKMLVKHVAETRKALDLQACLYPVLADATMQCLRSKEQWELTRALEQKFST